MSASQRVSRGFHRLAIFLAAIALVIGTILSVGVAFEQANRAKAKHDWQAKLVCARTALLNDPEDWVDVPNEDTEKPAPASGVQKSDPVEWPRDLKALGCSEWPQTATLDEIRAAKPPKDFSYAASLLPPLGLGLAVTLAVSLVIYGLVRAIGWVIGGFAAS